MYTIIKHSHLLFVVISILLFEYRFLLKMIKKPVGKVLSIVPHVNDTLLLATGITLAIITGFNPLDHAWLATKIITLFFYIGFGMLALKANGTKSIIGYVLATTAIVYMLFTAITKSPLFFSL